MRRLFIVFLQTFSFLITTERKVFVFEIWKMAIGAAVPNCALGPPPLPPGKRFLYKTSSNNSSGSPSSSATATSLGTKKNHPSMQSSTYLSFRDPAVESWIPMGIVVACPRETSNKPPINNRKLTKTERVSTGSIKTGSLSQNRSRNRALNMWQTNESLSRDLELSDRDEIDGPTRVIETNLFRSHSEGNLHTLKNNRSRGRANNVQGFSTPLDKCIKRIYGSWKNLLQRKIRHYFAQKPNISITPNPLFSSFLRVTNNKKTNRHVQPSIKSAGYTPNLSKAARPFWISISFITIFRKVFSFNFQF